MGTNLRSRVAAFFVASLVMAGSASATTLIHHDDFSDFDGTWTHNGATSGLLVQQNPGSALLASSQSSAIYEALGVTFLPTTMTTIDLDYGLLGGGFHLFATRWAADGTRIGEHDLGHNPASSIDLSGLDWTGTSYSRLMLRLDTSTRLILNDLNIHETPPGGGAGDPLYDGMMRSWGSKMGDVEYDQVADCNHDQVIGMPDLGCMLSGGGYAGGDPGAMSPIPEPSAALLMTVGMLITVGRMRYDR